MAATTSPCGHDVCLDRGVEKCLFSPMCNDLYCPEADFPHDPHSGSEVAP